MPEHAIQRFSVDAAHAMLLGHMGDRAGCEEVLREALAAEEDFKAAHPEMRGRSQLGKVSKWLDTGEH